MGTVFTVIGVALILLVAVVLLRTLSLKPTSAKTATVPQSDPVRAGEYGEKLGALLACETISEPVQPDRSKFYVYHEKLRELFPKVFETCELHDFNGSLLLKWAGKGNGLPIMLISHMDVVEATGEWEHDPFGGEVIDGNVWGRGAVDTKGSQFCFFQAAEELIASGYVPEVDVYLGGSCTEEVSGEGAPETARWLKEQGVKLGLLLDEGGMILNDPIGGVHGMYAMVGVLEKGYGDVKFVAHGKGGHASAPGSNTPWA
ncbi:MAG: M20/M25/M40 family metallo-hydrolase, partial [Lachnospiraceae bacterium]|nr:M20/M25/M40 family metallo-hydrolase [Lachnospiraceae bacterium]